MKVSSTHHVTKKGVVKKNPPAYSKKVYYVQYGVGSSKYLIAFHDGKKRHEDGSKFFDIQIFRNKKDLIVFENRLIEKGYVYRSAL